LNSEYDSFDLIFTDFYDKNYKYLVKYLAIFVNDKNMAEDLAHDIFLRVYRAKNFDVAGSRFKHYIKKAARNIAIDHLRRTAREDAKAKRLIPIIKELDETIYSALEDSVIGGEVLSTVHDVLDEFSERNKKIFNSRMFDRKTRKQISEEEEISSYIIKRIENEICYTLRKKLKDFID